jgi:hypothetical protein
MKPITIRNQQYYYKIVQGSSQYSFWVHTYIYKEIKEVQVKKNWFSNKTISKNITNPVAIIDYNIENPKYSKEKIRKSVERFLELEERKLEIERGEII